MAHFTKVLLPAPFSPNSAWKAPGLMRTETLSSAASAPKCLEKPISSSDGAPFGVGTCGAPITLMSGSSRDRLDHCGGVGNGAEHAALHLDHLERRKMIAFVGSAGAVLEDQAFEAAVVGLAHGGVHAD